MIALGLDMDSTKKNTRFEESISTQEASLMASSTAQKVFDCSLCRAADNGLSQDKFRTK